MDFLRPAKPFMGPKVYSPGIREANRESSESRLVLQYPVAVDVRAENYAVLYPMGG